MTEYAVTDEVRQDGESKEVADAETSLRRRDKRKAAKKEKRKQIRKELAETARAEEVARLNDPEEQLRIKLEEEREIERLERERLEFEEREKLFLKELARKRAEEEEEEERRKCYYEEELKLNQENAENKSNQDDDWEYAEEGPPEVIIIGNEIILKRKKVKVKKQHANNQAIKEDANRPTSNPLPPQSEAYSDYKNTPIVSAQQLLDNVAQQVPNFGTEQDKAHCPFHIKTGACRFGQRCSRVHFYPDKSCTILFKNMYNGPGLAWEQDEGLEHTDEEVEHAYEEFYEDVHTELLKFGEIVNFKVCRNGSFHLRGNVYVHYKSLDSAVLAYHSINARYFAGKQVNCEFVSVTKWKVAICGEYMKSRFKTCSRGTACNFIHCFRNPGGDYEWADWDKPPPRFWTTKMISLFGFSDDSHYDNMTEQDGDREYSRRSRSRERDSSSRSSRRNHNKERDVHSSSHQERHKNRTDGIDSDRELSDQGEERNKRRDHTRKSQKHRKEDSRTYRAESEDEREIQQRRKERKRREYTEDKSEKSDEAGRNPRRKVSKSSKEDSVLSEDYESARSEMRRRSKSSKISTRWDRSNVEKIEANERHRESADEILGKRKRHRRKHDSDNYDDGVDNDDRGKRSKSHDCKHYSDEKINRWEPKIDGVG